MIFSIIVFLRGYLVIEASGFFIERFINLAAKNNIFLWDIQKKNQTTAELKISIGGFKKIQKAAKTTKTTVTIKERRGLPLVLNKHKKRKAFFAGILLFAATIAVLSSFIWSVEITGTEKTDNKVLRDELRTCGIDTGVIKYNHSAQEIKRQMMILNPDIAWIWVDIKGTRAFVEVKERTEKPDIIPESEPCNIAAETDGVVSEMSVLEGKPVVGIGDVVKSGDLLVSGVDDSKHTGPVTYHANGEIYAATWYEDFGVFPLSRTDTVKTGNSQSRFYIKIGSFEIPVYPLSKLKFEKYEEHNEEKMLRLWGDLYLPVFWKSSYIEETSEAKYKMSAEEARDFYGRELCEKIKKTLRDDVEVTKNDITFDVQGDNIYVKCSLQCREEIGKQIPLYTD